MPLRGKARKRAWNATLFESVDDQLSIIGAIPMGRRGVHFAVTPEDARRLLDETENDEKVMEAVEKIEKRWDRDWLIETDKAWDAIHRCLTDGKLLYGDSPFHKCILGADNLLDGDDYIVNALDPQAVEEVCQAIKDIGEDWMRRKYEAIDPDDYGMPLSHSDFEYTWSNFESLKRFFENAAKHKRFVVFTV